MVFTNIQNGDPIDADYIMANIRHIPQYIDVMNGNTDTSLNTSATSGSSTVSKEFTAVTNSVEHDYLEIELSGALSTSDTDSYVTIKFEIKETGGSYSTIYNRQHSQISYSGTSNWILSTLDKFVYPLTTGMKTNGFQVKISVTVNDGSVNGASFFTYYAGIKLVPSYTQVN